MAKAGIVIDSWKNHIFARHLAQGGYKFEETDGLTEDTLTLMVETDNVQALYVVVNAANDEAKRTGRSATETQLAGGGPVTADHREINPVTGQQKGYVVLSAEERAKGYVRPVRRSYLHVGLQAQWGGPLLKKLGENGCGALTTMAQEIAETYARDPGFYSGTFCVGCRAHRPLTEFVWDGTQEQVGS